MGWGKFIDTAGLFGAYLAISSLFAHGFILLFSISPPLRGGDCTGTANVFQGIFQIELVSFMNLSKSSRFNKTLFPTMRI